MSKRDGEGPPTAAPFNDAFRELAGRLGSEPVPASAPPASDRGPQRRAPARAVVRLERKGRGGKEATIVEKLDLSAVERAEWLKQLKKALGCGGAVEGDALVLQGDCRGRVKKLLEEQGVRKVTVG